MNVTLPKSARGESVSQWAERHAAICTWAIAGFAVAIHALVVLRGVKNHVESTEGPNIAYALLAGRGFADAYGPGTGATAHLAPVYPLILAGFYKVFGFGNPGILAQVMFGWLQVAVIVFVLMRLAAACDLPRISGLLGGFIYAISISPSAESGASEAPLVAGLICVGTMGAIGLWNRGAWSVPEALATGLFCGFALLTGPPLVLWFAMLALLGMYFARSAAFLKFLFVAGAAAIAVLSPWIIRNERVLGAPIWSRSNFGFEFHLSHNDNARVEWQDYYDAGWVDKLHPSVSYTESRRVMQIGEVAYNREKMHEGLDWAAHHPAREAFLLTGRIFRFWFPTLRKSRIQTIIVWGGTVLGLAGFLLWFRLTDPAAWILGAMLLTFPLIYYLVYTTNRYRYPIVPVVALFTGEMVRRMAVRFGLTT